MAGYQYSQVRDDSGNSYPLDEFDMRTSLSSPWSPGDYTRQRQASLGSQDPLMQSPPYQADPGTPHIHTQSSYLRDVGPDMLQRDHSSKRQLLRLLWRVMVRFLVSVFFCAAIIVVFIVYEKMGVLDRDQKHMFNAIFLGLSLILSLNLISAFKSMAGMIRWRLLASSKHTLREVDLILSLSSFQKVLQLLWTWTRGSGRGKYSPDERISTSRLWGFRLGAAGWIILGLAAQVDVALVGLTFNHESEGAIGYVAGPVNITTLQYIYADYSFDLVPTLRDQKYAAHLYGLMSTNYDAEELDSDTSRTSLLGHGPENEWIYYFREWAATPGNNSQIPSTITNRSVAIYPVCKYAAITKGQYGENNTVIELVTNDNETETITWMKESEPNSTYVHIRKGADEIVLIFGPNYSVIVDPVWEVSGPIPLSCGPRCSRIYMFQFKDPAGPPTYGDFFNCTITVSEVRNADPNQSAHQMPDTTALIIAGASGSEGWKDSAGRQSAKYSTASLWGSPNGIGDQGELNAAWTIGRFSIGVVAGYDAYGPMVPAEGTQSWIGVFLVVKWLKLYLCLGGILIINLFLGIFVAFKASTVCCKDDSFLTTARLLRPLLDRLGPHGTYCDGKTLATTFDRKATYGVHKSKDGIHYLSIGEDIKPLVRSRFPDGRYD